MKQYPNFMFEPAHEPVQPTTEPDVMPGVAPTPTQDPNTIPIRRPDPGVEQRPKA